jgi:hypothetical protein
MAMRGTIAVALLALASPAGATPKLGYWGEDPKLVPWFAPVEERRAPKLPDSGPIWKSLSVDDGRVFADDLEDALLVCYAEISGKCGRRNYAASWVPPSCRDDWDWFNGPDALFRFQFGKDAPINLWGAEDHWKMYVSIPRLHMKHGETISVRAWDRDLTTNEYIGRAEAKWNGQELLEIHSRMLTIDCRVMTGEEALAGVGRRLQRIDDDFAAIEKSFQPGAFDPGVLDDRRRGLQGLSQSSFRYAAGFIGWEHPAIQERIARLPQLATAWNRAADALPPGSELTATTPHLRVRVVETRCGKKAGEAHHFGKGTGCAIALEWSSPGLVPAECRDLDLLPLFYASDGVPEGGGRLFDRNGAEIKCKWREPLPPSFTTWSWLPDLKSLPRVMQVLGRDKKTALRLE